MSAQPTMLAAVYCRAAACGVSLRRVPKPAITGNIYDPQGGKLTKRLLLGLLNLVASGVGLGLSVLRLVFGSIPPPYGEYHNRHGIMCKVHAVGVNPVDAKKLYGDKLPPIFHPIVEWFIEGRICGIDFSGVVERVPEGVDCGFKEGDEVYGEMPPFVGSFAEHVLAYSDFIALKPTNISHTAAAALPLTGLTVMQAFDDVGLQHGHRVCIIGASGGTGHIALQVARIRGAAVTAICSSKNAPLMKEYGADSTICYDTEDVVAGLQRVAAEHGLFDFVFDSVSSDDPRDAAHGYEEHIRNSQPPIFNNSEGVYIMLGGHVSDWLKAHIKRYFGINLFGKNRILHWVRFPTCFETLGRLAGYCEKGQLKVQLGKVSSFNEDEIRQMFSDIKSRRTVGKLAIKVA